MKNSSILIQDKPSDDQSYQDLARSLLEILNDPGGVTGNAKKTLMSKLSAIRSKGFALSPDENREILSNNPVANENFIIKIIIIWRKNFNNIT